MWSHGYALCVTARAGAVVAAHTTGAKLQEELDDLREDSEVSFHYYVTLSISAMPYSVFLSV
jgi:hypothetical protein